MMMMTTQIPAFKKLLRLKGFPKLSNSPKKHLCLMVSVLGTSEVLQPIRPAVQGVLLTQSQECQLVVMHSGAHFQQAVITVLGGCPPLASWQLSVSEKKSMWAAHLLWIKK